MDYYINIKIKPDAEMRENVLLNKVFTKFHKALWDMASIKIGVSFPLFKIKLGRVLRIHGSLQDLKRLQKKDWLGELIKYCVITEIKLVPLKEIKHRVVSRKQVNMTSAKLRRLKKRGHIPQEDFKQYKIKMFQQGIINPYLEIKSASNGEKYRQYVDFGVLSENPQEGDFNSFGFSISATIPWF